MQYSVAILIIYAILIIFCTYLVEKRLSILTERHHQKIGGGYAAFGLFSLNNKLKIIIRIIALTLFLAGSFITITIL